MESPEAATTEFPSVASDATPGESPASAHVAASDDTFAQRPEVFVGAAFAGGLLVAQILKRLGR